MLRWCFALVPAYFAYTVYSNYKNLMTKRGKPLLYSLKISHYVEKARWTLDLLGIAYDERFSYAVLGIVLTGKTLPTLQIDSRTILGDSDDILAYLRGKYPKGNFLSADLSDEDRQLLDGMMEFGMHVRRFLYGHLLQKSPHIVKRLWREGTGPVVSAIGDFVLFPIAKQVLIFLLRIHPKGIERSRIEVDKVVDKIDALLSDGREFLNGKELSELDIVFCSLAAVLVMEPKYGGGALPRLDDLDPVTRAAVAPYQARPFASYCHRIYNKHRPAKADAQITAA